MYFVIVFLSFTFDKRYKIFIFLHFILNLDFYCEMTSTNSTSTNVVIGVKTSCIQTALQAAKALKLSAPVERLFSFAGMIYRPHRRRLTPEHLELLVMLKNN